MSAWSNIPTSSEDPEIIKINRLETKLGNLPDNVYKIRELITRLEVCHFKLKRHIKKIKDSIINLETDINPNKIGINHVKHGENAWKKDTTGKSLPGQKYVWAIQSFLGDILTNEFPEKYDTMLGQKVQKWLRDKNEDKIRLIRLLLARLTWNWKLYEELQHGKEYKELEFQICRMDICHYAFPENLDRLLKGIGEMKPIENFEGCGSFNNDIMKFVKKELVNLNDLFTSQYNDNNSDEKGQIKAWLTACLIKTLKEQVDLSEPEIKLKN